ncbi:MAG: methylaspartate mutase [Candidatus Muiribacterium halophilum]|uniref:Methylaspartate mutase n=1 Tax=Muiribacterium halophilum TaxID=2053465 RepID=A0A2N5ZFK2_MUIH1|nr:MAG: methylaspartate mutase [Candidatus Muirbacterium halophilum]
MGNNIDKSKIRRIVATDCGSTTTKAILIEKQNDEYRLVTRGEAPTTVEAPVEDVTKGVINAVTELEELRGIKILDNEEFIKDYSEEKGIDLYISTSSAGGGLQMMVAGVVKSMTAESAARAALGAGAIVMDTIANNDGRKPYQKIQRIRNLRPDMILLSGGVNGGTIKHVVELGEIIGAADPRPRLGSSYNLPVIFAGNQDAIPEIKKILEKKVALDITENLRPTLEKEDLMPSRLKIQAQFLEHVMAQAPGYKKLMAMTDVDIMPTPGAVGQIMETIADINKIEVVGVDIGGATTDVFSVFDNPDEEGKTVFNRTVSANLGMSYSISNVVSEAGLENVLRWIPFGMNEAELRNKVKNKMIRPTTIPHLLEELMFEQAVAREALRRSFEQHKALAVGLKGVQKQRTVSDVFSQEDLHTSLVNMLNLDMLIGSGGVLSHAPRRNQSAMMLIDAFLPEGFTTLTVDSIFMMPQLGVLAEVHPEAATQVFEKDCLIYLGTCIAPVGTTKYEKKCMDYTVTYSDGKTAEGEVRFGDMKVVPLAVGEKAKVKVNPAKGFDMGDGAGNSVEKEVTGGTVGLIFDARGRRPFSVPETEEERISFLKKWYTEMNLYPGYEK